MSKSSHSDSLLTPIDSALGAVVKALDVSRPVPPATIPERGGDTSFYNMHLAYETLDSATQQRIEGLQLITYNPFLHVQGEPRSKYRLEAKELISPVFPHPLVRTHPDSGKRILFLDAATEVEVVGLAPRLGAELIEQLRAHIEQARFRYTHRWTVGDIVYWDNQAVLHARTAFDPGSRRVLKRVSLAGSRPF